MKRLFALSLVCLTVLVFMPGFVAAQESVDHVVVVLDASGSMGTNMKDSSVKKIDAAKEALKQVLRQVPDSTHIGVIVFSAEGLKDKWVFPLGPRDDQRITAAIDSIQTKSGTPLGEYIKYGADRLLQARAEQFGYGTYRLLVVTDGEANDAKLVERYTPEVVSRGIIMDVIGVDMNQRHTLATKVHSYRSANNPESLKQAVADVFAELNNSNTDTAEEDAFSLIAPLPMETASAALMALATSGNDPIGTQPAVTKSSSTTTSQTPPTQPSQAKERRGFKPSLLMIIVMLGVIVAVIRGVARRAGRR